MPFFNLRSDTHRILIHVRMNRGATEWNINGVDKVKKMLGKSRLSNARAFTHCGPTVFEHGLFIDEASQEPVVSGRGFIEPFGMLDRGQFSDPSG